MNHIQCVRFRPARSSANAAAKTGSWAATNRFRSWGSVSVMRFPSCGARSAPAGGPGGANSARLWFALCRLAASCFCLQAVDLLRGFRLCQILVHLLVSLLRKRVQVRFLRPGHLLLSGHPLVRVLDAVRILGFFLLGHCTCSLLVLQGKTLGQ